MCYIFAYLNDSIKDIQKGIVSNKYSFTKIEEQIYFGFHNGLLIQYKHLSLVFNGVIYPSLTQSYSQGEMILHLYEQFGLDSFSLLDGEFSFILYDNLKKEIVVVRDPFGVRSLYENHTKDGYMFSSVLESILLGTNKEVSQVKPGTYSIYRFNGINFYKYVTHSYYNIRETYDLSLTREEYMVHVYNLFEEAVIKRMSDGPVCCLLSGGLYSSLVCAIASRYYREKDIQLHTFSIGLQDSEDLYNASIVAKHIHSIHHEVICSEDEFINCIPYVVQNIESYDTTTIRSSVGNWLIGKYIKENTDFKVVLNGDGADELMGGNFNFCDTNNSFHEECIRELENIHYFDLLRSDKSMSSHKLESRSPYLDKKFTKFYLSIPTKYRKNVVEKYFIRSIFEIMDKDILPYKILWRQKEEFSDGVSSLYNLWYKIIQERLKNYKSKNALTKEQTYYKDLFTTYYPGCEHLIPYTSQFTSIELYSRNIIYKYFYIVKHFFTGIIMNCYRQFFF